jgi:hypothetical protein
MVKKMLIAMTLLVAASLSFPLSATSRWDFSGRITARDATSITIFDKEQVKLAFDESTTITPWIREKPYVRKTTYLTPSALRFGGLVRVRTRGGSRVADFVEVANDVKKTFDGRVVAYDDSSVSVYTKDMDVVKLRFDHDTAFRELFTVKPWIRPAVKLTPIDLKIGSRVIFYYSKEDAHKAHPLENPVGEKQRAAEGAKNFDN